MITLPRIIPRAQHPISRSSLSPNALRVLYRLKDHGFIAYLVGGGVRDLWLGREPKDFDVVTDATPGQLKRLFRNCRLIGRRFRLAHLHFSDEIIEVATFRSHETEPDGEFPPESEPGRKRGPQHLKDDEGMVLRDNVFGSPEEDARRRDFTVNALCYTVEDFSIIDHVGGVEDLERGIIRTIGDPVVRFTEDPVRMIRAVRFAAILGFAIEDETWHAMVQLGSTVSRAAPSRLYDEVLKLFHSGEGEKCYQLMRQTGLMEALFPHFNAWLATESDGFPHTWVTKAFDRIDVAGQRGEKPTPQLLLALIFGQYLEEKADGFRRTGAPGQQAVDLALSEFLGELAPTVLIPHKTGMLVRDILSCQHRFRKMPGRQPGPFVARSGFPAAFAYLQFTNEVAGESGALVTWWETFLRSQPDPLPGVIVASDDGEPPEVKGKRKRPRKRRRRHAAKGDAGPGSAPGEAGPLA